VSSEIPATNNSTRGSSAPAESASDCISHGMSCRAKSFPHDPSNTPASLRPRQDQALASNCRINWTREAPSAVRIAISFSRRVDRDSSKVRDIEAG